MLLWQNNVIKGAYRSWLKDYTQIRYK